MIEELLKKHLPDLIAIRQDLHAHAEMLFQEERTAKIVADECRRLGFDVTTGIAKTGVVACLSNGTSKRTIGIRFAHSSRNSRSSSRARCWPTHLCGPLPRLL